MSALSEVIAQLRAALDHVAQARQCLRQAAEHHDSAVAHLTDTLHGATHPDAQHARTHHATARERTRTALASTDQAEQRIRAYLRHIDGDPGRVPIPADERRPDPGANGCAGSAPTAGEQPR